MNAELRVTVTVLEGTQAFEDLQRLSRGGERPTVALRRMMARYRAIMDHTTPSPANIVRDLASTFRVARLDTLSGIGYPEKIDVMDIVRSSALPPTDRARLVEYIEAISYAEFYKLIEAMELTFLS